MMKKALKVAVVYNEAHPDFYHTNDQLDQQPMDFVPYFEVEKLTPMEEYEILAQRLCECGLNAYTLNITDNIQKLLRDIKKNSPDVIFNFIELYQENARLEMNAVSFLELSGVPYTGAPPMALANCQSKMLAKRLLKSYGIQTPEFIIIKELKKKYNHNLKYPLMVKPAFEDASVGIENSSIVENEKKLRDRIEFVHTSFCQPALVEEFIDGRELNVAVMGDKKPAALPISEIDFTEMPDHLYNIVSYQAKWDPLHEAYHKTIPVCPAVLPAGIEKKAKEIAVNAFKIMGCRDYARIDMRLSKDNQLYVLEVNPNPDLTESAGFMRSAEAAKLSYTDTLIKIIEFAHQRGQKDTVNLNHFN